jgi:hypothetical protein
MKEAWLFQGAVVPVDTETTQALVAEIKRLIDVVGGMALECPNCEYHKKRAQLWRDEAYKQAGHPLPDREWVGLTDEEIKAFDTWHDNREEEIGWVNPSEIVAYIEAKLKEKNT